MTKPQLIQNANTKDTMVARALSLRRGHAALTLDTDNNTAAAPASAKSATSPGYVTIPVIITTPAQRKALPLSQHHRRLRSSSVSTNGGSTVSSCSFGGEDGRSVVVVVGEEDENEGREAAN